MNGRWMGLACLLTAAAAVLFAAARPGKRAVARAEAGLFEDREVERQVRSWLGELSLDEDALAELRTLSLESGHGGEIASLGDLPRLTPGLQVLDLGFYDRPLTEADWVALEGLPRLRALIWADGRHRVAAEDWAHLGRLRLTGLGIYAEDFETFHLPEDLRNLSLLIPQMEERFLPDTLLLTPLAQPLSGGITQYYRYLRDGLAVELVQTDIWVQETWAAEGGWETRLRISRPAAEGWTEVEAFEIEERPNAGDGVLFQDVDFDGRDDLLVMQGHFGAQGLVRYAAFLQREDGAYAPCPSFSDIPNPAVDPERRAVYGQWRNSASSHSWAVYECETGAFRPARSLREELAGMDDGEPWQYVVEGSGPTEVWRTDEHTVEETWDRFFDDSSPDWGIASDRWRTLSNNGLLADFSIYASASMAGIIQETGSGESRRPAGAA